MLAVLYEVGDDRHLPAELRPEGSGLRYRARPRHVQRSRRTPGPGAVRGEEVAALLRACRCWRDRLLVVMLWFCGLRIGEALGLRRADLHLTASAQALGCAVHGPHLHVVDRDSNANGAHAKGADRHVPVRAEVLACYDHYLAERGACREAEGCDFVFVNLFHAPVGRPMSDHTVRQWLAALSGRAGLERTHQAAHVPPRHRHRAVGTGRRPRRRQGALGSRLDPLDRVLPASRRRRPAGGGGPARPAAR